MTNPNVELIISYYEAFNRRDFDAYDDKFGPDVSFRSVGGVAGTGVEAVKSFDTGWTRAMSDFIVVGGYHVGDGDRVVCHNRATGVHDGLLLLPDGSQVPPTGHRLDAPYFASFEVRGGRIVSEEIYFDRMLLIEQLQLDLAATA